MQEPEVFIIHSKEGKRTFQKSLQQRREDFNDFKSKVEKNDHPIQLIKDFFISVAVASEKAHMKGCIVANTLVEMTFVDDELENEAVEILKETEQLYTSIIAKEQQNGNIKSKLPADLLGKFLITLWCGINSLRRMYPDEKILKQQIELQLQIIE